jgi:hypothetical protein
MTAKVITRDKEKNGRIYTERTQMYAQNCHVQKPGNTYYSPQARNHWPHTHTLNFHLRFHSTIAQKCFTRSTTRWRMKDTTSRTHMGAPTSPRVLCEGTGAVVGSGGRSKMLGHVRPPRTCAGCLSLFLSHSLSRYNPLSGILQRLFPFHFIPLFHILIPAFNLFPSSFLLISPPFRTTLRFRTSPVTLKYFTFNVKRSH